MIIDCLRGISCYFGVLTQARTLTVHLSAGKQRTHDVDKLTNKAYVVRCKNGELELHTENTGLAWPSRAFAS